MLTDYARNKMMDAAFRGQAIVFPATFYVALFTVVPAAAGGGTEVVHADYARFPYASTLLKWSGTQGAGTTGVSNGSSGLMSNNDVLEYAATLSAALSGVCATGLFDASSAGNLWHFGLIKDSDGDPTIRSFSAGDRLAFDEDTLELSWT
jgi:hypothetical protein